jgi:hypothetical protein
MKWKNQVTANVAVKTEINPLSGFSHHAPTSFYAALEPNPGPTARLISSFLRTERSWEHHASPSPTKSSPVRFLWACKNILPLEAAAVAMTVTDE